MPGFIVYIKRHLPSAPFYESHSHRRSCLSASERTQPSIPTAQARILGQQADPQTLAEPHAHIKRPARLQPASCQKTCPMGRAVSEGLRPLHFYNSLRSIGATANLVIPPKIAYLYTNKINLRETLTKHHNRAEDSGLNRSPILQCSRMAILDTICLLRHQ